MNKVAEEEKIECTDEEIEAEFTRLAELYQMDVENVKKAVSAETLARDLRMRKAASVIYDTGIPTEPVEEEAKEDGGEELKAEKKTRSRKTKAKAEEAKEEETAGKAE